MRRGYSGLIQAVMRQMCWLMSHHQDALGFSIQLAHDPISTKDNGVAGGGSLAIHRIDLANLALALG